MWSAVDMFSIVFEQREASAKYAEGNPKFTDLSRDDYEQIQLLLGWTSVGPNKSACAVWPAGLLSVLPDTCRVGTRRMFAEARQMHRSRRASVVSPRRRL
jgi:hypothetical protein